jgi:hypothetical protein
MKVFLETSRLLLGEFVPEDVTWDSLNREDYFRTISSALK